MLASSAHMTEEEAFDENSAISTGQCQNKWGWGEILGILGIGIAQRLTGPGPG